MAYKVWARLGFPKGGFGSLGPNWLFCGKGHFVLKEFGLSVIIIGKKKRNGRIHLTVSRGSNLLPADDNGKSDPYCVVIPKTLFF